MESRGVMDVMEQIKRVQVDKSGKKRKYEEKWRDQKRVQKEMFSKPLYSFNPYYE
jgi:hypothetical protein